MKKFTFATILVALIVSIALFSSAESAHPMWTHTVDGFSFKLPAGWLDTTGKVDGLECHYFYGNIFDPYSSFMYVYAQSVVMPVSQDYVEYFYDAALINMQIINAKHMTIDIGGEKAYLWSGYRTLNDDTSHDLYGVMLYHDQRLLICRYIADKTAREDAAAFVEAFAASITVEDIDDTWY